jgi:hypothetical protein
MAHGGDEREDARRRWERQRAKFVWGPGDIRITKRPGEPEDRGRGKVPRRLGNGNLLVPVAFENPDTGALFDGTTEIGPDHPDYAAYLAEVEAEGRPGA